MRILLASGIYPPDAGGPATYTRALARALVARGHEARVLCYADTDRMDEGDGFIVERISRALPLWRRYWSYLKAVKRIAPYVDLIYLQGPGSEGFPGMIAARYCGKKTVMKIVGDYAWEMYRQEGEGEGRKGKRERGKEKGEKRKRNDELLDEFLLHRHAGKIRLLEFMERWSSRRADRLVAPSKYIASVARAWGVRSDRIRVIQNAAEPLPESAHREALRSAERLSDYRIMLFALRCVPWKRVDFILDVLKDLPSDIFLVIAGDGPLLASWKTLAQTLGVAHRVRFLGRVDRATLAGWYRAADVLILPTGYEGFPHVVPEAASVGLPSFVSDKGGNPETRELLGDGLVRVIPYADRAAWHAALSEPWPARVAPVMPVELRFDAMIERTIALLQEVCQK